MAEDRHNGLVDDQSGEPGAQRNSLANVVSFCNNLPISLYADTTVVKSPEIVYRGLLFSRNRLLGEEFLLNFRRNEADMGPAIGAGNFSQPSVLEALVRRGQPEHPERLLELPKPKQVRAPLSSVMRTRRSVRSYSNEALGLADLATVLHFASGVSGNLESNGTGHSVELRMAPSGGALYPIEVHVLALNVNGLDAGAYQYWPKQHALGRRPEQMELPELRRLAQFGEIEIERAAAMLVYVYNVFENARKYGDASTAFAFIEVGALAAHVHLMCTALGIGSCDVGGFSKAKLERALHVDGLSRHVLHLTVLGR
jgi:SagB-type dehydrogenase family enzyme